MKRIVRMALVLCLAAVTNSARAGDTEVPEGTLLGLGEGYEIRYVQTPATAPLQTGVFNFQGGVLQFAGSTSVAGATAPSGASGNTASVPAAAKVTSAGSFNSSTAVVLSSGTLTLGTMNTGTMPVISIATPASGASPQFSGLTIKQPPGKLVYTNLKTGRKTTFDNATDVVSAAADDQYVYTVEYVNTTLGMITISCATTSMMTPVYQLMLTARPLSGNGKMVTVEVETKVNPTANDLPKNLNLTLKDGLLGVGSLDRYKFDGKAFRIVY